MPQRPSWKDNLWLLTGSCPVALCTAVSSRAGLSFNLLHKDTYDRINMKPVDPERLHRLTFSATLRVSARTPAA